MFINKRCKKFEKQKYIEFYFLHLQWQNFNGTKNLQLVNLHYLLTKKKFGNCHGQEILRKNFASNFFAPKNKKLRNMRIKSKPKMV